MTPPDASQPEASQPDASQPDAIASETDVLIIGGGPVGIVGALLLARAGLRVRVAEKEADIYPLPRAAHIDHEAMRVLQAAGVGDEVLATTREAARYDFVNKSGDVLMRFETGQGQTLSGWPASNMIHQPSIERILRDALDRMPNAGLHTQWTFTGFTQDAAGVTAAFTTPHGNRSIRARYVLACDGANSPSRHAANIAMHDLGFDESWLVVDTIIKDASPLPDCNLQLCDPLRPTTCVQMGQGRHRWEFMLMPGDTPDTIQHPDKIAELMAPWEVDGAVDIERMAVYRFGAKLAQHWRQGRILFAGDAAHLMPPFAGQGLCSGLRDVANLAWKLALVLQQSVDDALLDSYQREREPHVQAVIDLGITLGQVVCMTDPEAAAMRDAQLISQRRKNGDAAGALALPPLGNGVFRTDDAQAGNLMPQFERSDEVFGPGPCLICETPPPPDLPINYLALNDPQLEHSAAALKRWLAEQKAEAVLVRGDKYIFGVGEARDLSAAFAQAIDCKP